MFANPKHEAAHKLLNEGKVIEAIQLYSEALELNPNDPDIYSDRGVAHLHNLDKEQCFKDLNTALDLQPNYSYRYAARAYAKNNFGDTAGAILDYEKAVELDPDDAIAYNNLGLLLEQQGYKKAAEERFARADKLSKIEDHLLDVIDELDQQPNGVESEIVEEVQDSESIREVQEEVEPKLQQNNTLEFKKIFTSKSQFAEFLRFIKNGFRIK
jgi:tetratricopeptide (TPR) repeat protein